MCKPIASSSTLPHFAKKALVIASALIVLVAAAVIGYLISPCIGSSGYWVGGASAVLGLLVVYLAAKDSLCKTGPSADQNSQPKLKDIQRQEERSFPIQKANNSSSKTPALRTTVSSGAENRTKDFIKEYKTEYRRESSTWVANDHIYCYFYYLKEKYKNFTLPQEGGTCSSDGEPIVGIYVLGLIDKIIHNPDNVLHKQNLALCLAIGEPTHWVLLYIDRERRTLEYYDSFAGYGNYEGESEYAQAQRVLKKAAEDLALMDPKEGQPYRVLLKVEEGNPLQADGYQCGVWVGWFLDQRSTNPDFDPNLMDRAKRAEFIANYRVTMGERLIEWENSSSN